MRKGTKVRGAFLTDDALPKYYNHPFGHPSEVNRANLASHAELGSANITVKQILMAAYLLII